VHDDRKNRKQEEEMNENSGRLENQKAPDPDNKQNDSKNEKHRYTLFPVAGKGANAPVAKKRNSPFTLPVLSGCQEPAQDNVRQTAGIY
jgi:hypothetical protein